MDKYYTHWEFSGGLAALVIREYLTSNFSVSRRIWFTMEDYNQLTSK